MAYPDSSVQYETVTADNQRRRGPLRFEEGLVTDTDIPNEFRRGAYGDQGTAEQGWPTKSPGETMRERAHVGSASWIDAPSLLSEFVQGAHGGPNSFEHETNPGTIQRRPNRAVVND